MPIAEELMVEASIDQLAGIEEAPPPQEAVDREELARLAFWHWEMRGYPMDNSRVDWFWAEEELRRERYAELVATGHELDAA